MGIITVVNKHKHKPTDNDFFIGRGSPLGNPFTSKELSTTKAKFQCKTAEESIEKFRNDILEKIKNKDKEVCDELNRIWKHLQKKDVNLVCYCKPKICHGDIIKEIIESRIELEK